MVACAVLPALVTPSPAAASVSTGDTGWLWQNPRPQGDPVNAIDLVDANLGFAVGGQSYLYNGTFGGGMVLRTTDGGATWTTVAHTPHPLRSVCFVSPSLGWAVCGSDVLGSGAGEVMKTADGGTSWTAQAAGTQEPLAAVCFTDARNGWAVGGRDFDGYGEPTQVIVHTGDGGETWTQQYFRPETDETEGALTAADFVDATKGWAVSADGEILATTDGGRNWTSQFTREDAGFQDVAFADARHGWAVGGAILHTADGGAHWTRQDADTAAGLLAVAASDQSTACAVGRQGIVLRTTDSGLHWTTVSVDSTADIADVDFADGNVGCTAGPLLRTSDGGASWSPLGSSAADEDLLAADLVDETTGWVTGNDGVILRTTDGGRSWRRQDSGVTDNLAAVEFLNADAGWAVGGTFDSTWSGQARRVILHTNDGGRHWRRQLDASGPMLHAITFTSRRSGWAVGGHDLLRSRDAGKTWKVWRTWPNARLVDLDFVGASTGWVLADSWANVGACVLRTTDGGRHWTRYRVPEETPGQTDIVRMDFVSRSVGVVVGGWEGTGGFDDWGEIYRTSDGGQTWTSVSWRWQGSPPAVPVLSAVGFADRLNGWAVGQWGSIVHTRDGGLTWSPQLSGATRQLNAVAFVDRASGWMVGANGTILHTATGGATDGSSPWRRHR